MPGLAFQYGQEFQPARGRSSGAAPFSWESRKGRPPPAKRRNGGGPKSTCGAGPQGLARDPRSRWNRSTMEPGRKSAGILNPSIPLTRNGRERLRQPRRGDVKPRIRRIYSGITTDLRFYRQEGIAPRLQSVRLVRSRRATHCSGAAKSVVPERRRALLRQPCRRVAGIR